jgi:hypothetical protein
LSSGLVPIVGGDLADVKAFVAQTLQVRRLMREAREQELGLLRRLGGHEVPMRTWRSSAVRCSHARYAVRSLGERRMLPFSARIVRIVLGSRADVV